MLLQGKNAVIYGAGGSLGGAVARAFAAAGAQVFLSGLHEHNVRETAEGIIAAGGNASQAVVDALDKRAVDQHMESVVRQAGSVDISFNAIGWRDVQNMPLTEMEPDDFLRPLNVAMTTQFLTGTAAGRVMKQQQSGVILSLTATPGGIGYPMTGGFGPACCAVEGFSRNFASEMGQFGVRVVNIRSAGSPDSRPFMEAMAADQEMGTWFLNKLKDDTMLKALPAMEDIANVAVFLASPMAGKITGVTIDVTAGTTTGINYRIADIPLVSA
ncbi:SDR family NAD(P)-dependent oxidoreductase [Chitinophaga solisilvae]|uniref:SDR family NAD(P)-dependent oxidoreductase n=1 Tax=Chitinophaga solisilvae TaxID=1233460 RepID=UPI00136A3EE7|nr:SDR family oxidoreductase [Chitinophaga solisilvae]